MDKKKKIEELRNLIENMKANMNACGGAIKILEEQIAEEETPKFKEKPKEKKIS